MILKIDKDKISKILIIQTAFLGDVILITPLIKAVKNKFSSAIIDVLVSAENYEVLQNTPYINSVIKFDKKNDKLKSFIMNALRLRKNNYDLLLSLHSSVTTGLLISFMKIKYRVGFRRWLSQIFYNIKVEHLSDTLKIKKNLHLLSPFGINENDVQTELYPTSEMRFEVKNKISELKKISVKLIAIAPGSMWETKKWPKENYKKLISQLTINNYGVVFVGSKVERELCEEIKPDRNYVNFAGELSVLESAAVIELCDLMICNDSGAMHIANAMKTDVFAFFGPTVKEIGYFPFRENDKVFEVNLDCRPCGSHGSKKCPLGHFNCMNSISVESVLKEIKLKFV
ncbi:MAG: lipopolysaccharide heptosyltransferase II [Ignavibacteriales bacterium CG_4_9_14_3_um_filter_34_10]|nr:MAG: lipopolysaccharide heptosyltransferase II [Ignavibacteriales bacterium CG_4_9_14_3_um_filter_34_10]